VTPRPTWADPDVVPVVARLLRDLPRPLKNWGAPWLVREIQAAWWWPTVCKSGAFPEPNRSGAGSKRSEVPVPQRKSSLRRSKPVVHSRMRHRAREAGPASITMTRRASEVADENYPS